MPMSNSNMKIWLAMALVMVVTMTMVMVNRTAEMPLKKPSAAQHMAPTNAPPMRGVQYSSASASTCASRPKGCSSQGPAKASARNSGAMASVAHRAFHSAREARALRRLPKACATKVCTARPTPPNSSTAQVRIQ